MNSCSTDLPNASAHDFVELLWENGQVVMQSHTGRSRNRYLMPSPIQEKDGNDAAIVKAGKYAVPEFNSTHEDDWVPCWVNRPGEDSLQDDCRPELLTDLLCPNPKPVSAQHFSVPVLRNSRFSQAVRDPKVVSAHEEADLQRDNVSKAGGEGSDLVKFMSSPLFQSSQQFPLSEPKSGVSASLPNSTQQSQCPSSMKNDPLPTRPLQPCNNTGVMNFSLFSRPAALYKANLQNFGFLGAVSSGVDTFRGSGKAPVEPSVVKSTSSLRCISEDQLILAQAKVDPKSPTTPQEVVSTKQSEAICREDALRNHRSLDHHCPSSSFAASFTLGHPKGKKAFVTSVASSSGCSGNSTDGVSRDTEHGLKRISQVAEESECQSDDAEDESVDVKRPTKCLKRSRSTEVHNLSERADKASMLDEAIEYLKTLQLQVQSRGQPSRNVGNVPTGSEIMAMGSGLCMPPMMFPADIQKIQPSPITHFPSMGIGMNMGFGMGMHDLSRSLGYPLISAPPMQGLQFPCTSVSGLTDETKNFKSSNSSNRAVLQCCR
ncbi:hypothetical protein ACLOJK_022154 [Asimina triloba]